MKLPSVPHLGAGVELSQIERLVVQNLLCLGVGREEDLEPAVQSETVHKIRADPTSHVVRGLHESKADAAVV